MYSNINAKFWGGSYWSVCNSVAAMYPDNPDEEFCFWLMSKCNGSIIANSSFSWWATYINNNPYKLIISPFIKSFYIIYIL